MKSHTLAESFSHMSHGVPTRIAGNLQKPCVIKALNLIRARRPAPYDFPSKLAEDFEHAHCLDRVVESDGEPVLS